MTSVIIAKWEALAPYFQSALRVVAALMFMMVGTMKLFAFPIGIPPAGGTVPLASLIGIAGILEVFGGGLILLGLFTRPVAFVLAGEMAFAYFIGHASQAFWPLVNGGTDAVLYSFLWLYFSAAGAGPWSLDAKRGK
jgi:putative oxidoreductase